MEEEEGEEEREEEEEEEREEEGELEINTHYNVFKSSDGVEVNFNYDFNQPIEYLLIQ